MPEMFLGLDRQFFVGCRHFSRRPAGLDGATEYRAEPE
jgi:hypothetical protein